MVMLQIAEFLAALTNYWHICAIFPDLYYPHGHQLSLLGIFERYLPSDRIVESRPSIMCCICSIAWTRNKCSL